MQASAFDPSGIPVSEFEEADLHALFSLGEIGIVQVDVETRRFVRVNQSFADLVGYTPGELELLSFVDLSHPGDVVDNVGTFAQLVRGEIATAVTEKRLRRKDGAWLWVAITAAIVRNREGRPLRTLAVVQDITDRRRRELQGRVITAIQETLSQLKQGPELVDAVAQILIRALELTHVSFIGFDDEDEAVILRGRGIRSDSTLGLRYLSPPILDQLSAGHSVAIADVRDEPRFAPPPSGAEDCLAIVYTPQRRDGRCRFILAAEDCRPRRWQPHEIELLREVTGRVWLLLERNRAEAALQENEERLRRLVNVETVGVLFFRLTGLIQDANDAFLRLTGYSRDELRQGKVRRENLFAAESLAQTNEALSQLRQCGRTLPYEAELRSQDGKRRTVLSCSCLVAEGEAVEFMIDVTEQKEANEQLTGYRDELEQRVLERTAELDAANGALRDELLERSRDDSERRELLARIVNAQEHERRRLSRELHDQLGQLITGLILGLKSPDLAQAGPAAQNRLKQLQHLAETIGKEIHDVALALRPTALDDLGLVHALENFVSEWSTRALVEVEFHAGEWEGERLPPEVETTIFRLVSEALTNVQKHASANRVSLILKREQDQVTAIIEDDGCGFAPGHTHLPGGRRLGLVGMRERAALVRGAVEIESVPGQGTTVFVRIPLSKNFPS